jgi:predicted AAA+ superfamily ATPase
MARLRMLPRFVAPRLRQSLADSPVVLIHGPRQSGKTTLARVVGERRGYRLLLVRRGGGARFRTSVSERLGPALADRIAAGGYPAALVRRGAARQAAWYHDYAETQVQRDVRDLAQIRSLDALPRLLAASAAYTARLVNVSDLAGPFQLSRQTVHDYVALLERVFLLERVPPWHSNRLSRLVKTPKLHMGDTGIACAVLGLDAGQLWQDRASLGRMLETFVYQELRRQASSPPLRVLPLLSRRSGSGGNRSSTRARSRSRTSVSASISSRRASRSSGACGPRRSRASRAGTTRSTALSATRRPCSDRTRRSGS